MGGPIPLVEKSFGLNDIFVIICCLIGFTALFLLPKRFSRQVTILILFFSSTVASIFDNSIGADIFDFYDIMDGPKYTVADFVVYFMYAPIGYFFIYLYDQFHPRNAWIVGYILLWSVASIGFEWLCVRFGVFHYKNGYGIYFSFPIYLFTQSATILFYNYIKVDRVAKS